VCQHSPYAAAVAATLDLAGEPVQPPDASARAPAEPAIDDEWREPDAFGGCPATVSHYAPDIRTIQFVRRDATSFAAPKEGLL